MSFNIYKFLFIFKLYEDRCLTAVQYSCIGCVSLWFFALRPEKKQFWHMSKLKHFKQRYLKNSNIFYVNMFRQFYMLSTFSSKNESYLNPMIGYSLHILHLAWCLAVSAADNLCSTGNQTMLCGSCCSQLKKCTASISFLSFPAFSKQLRTLGSMFEPPNAATSPNCLGTCMQSCNKSPSFRWSTNLLGSAIKRNRSVNNIKVFLETHLI